MLTRPPVSHPPKPAGQPRRPQRRRARAGPRWSAHRLAAALALLALSGGVLAACQGASVDPGEDAQGPADATDTISSAEPDEPTVAPARESYAGSTPAPEFPTGLDWLNTDRPLTLAELRGKLVLLDFWTYGCINCMHNFPGLKRLEREFEDELVVIGVHSAKFENEAETENIRQIILRYDLEHPVVNDDRFIVWNTWGARAWPTLVLIDPLGNIVGGHSGEGVYQIFQPVVASLVQEFDERGLLDRSPLDLKLEREGLPSGVLSFPGKVLADAARARIFIADTDHNRILQAELPTGRLVAVYGSGEAAFSDGVGTGAAFYNPQGMALSADGETLYVADVDNHAVRAIELSSGEVTTLVGTGFQAQQYPPEGGLAPAVALNSPWDLALDGDWLYIAMAGSHQIWRMDLSNGLVQPFAGSGREGWADGHRLSAELAQPSGLVIGPHGRLYFADSEASSIRWVDLVGDSDDVGTLVGSGSGLFDFGDADGVGNEARLQHPLGIATDGELLYVADTYNSKLKLLDPQSAEISTLWGDGHGWRDGLDPLFYEPGGLHLDGELLYVADTNNHAIRVVELSSGETSTLVLSGVEQFSPLPDSGIADVVLPELVVAAGPAVVTLDVHTPAGYKFNPLAPTAVRWETEGGVVAEAADANLSLPEPDFPIDFHFDFQQGSGSLIADLTLYYCEADREQLCLIDQVRLIQPLQVEEAGADRLNLDYGIPVPDLPGS